MLLWLWVLIILLTVTNPIISVINGVMALGAYNPAYCNQPYISVINGVMSLDAYNSHYCNQPYNISY